MLKEIRSRYHGWQMQVKQVILQCAAAVAAQIFRICSLHIQERVCLVDLNHSLLSKSIHDYTCPSGQQADKPVAEETCEWRTPPSQIHVQKEYAVWAVWLLAASEMQGLEERALSGQGTKQTWHSEDWHKHCPAGPLSGPQSNEGTPIANVCMSWSKFRVSSMSS